jgi:hypothetical protein
MRISFKAKHLEGARYMGFEPVQYLGKSKIDGFPMFSYETEDKKIKLSYVWSLFVFNGRPGYTPTESDFELVPSVGDVFEPRLNMTERYFGKNILGTDDIIPAQALPLPEPLGILYYFDYVLGSEFDERLLLML